MTSNRATVWHLLMLSLLGSFWLGLTSSVGFAGVPQDTTYTGRLLDSGGTPMTGSVNIQLRIYESPFPLTPETPLYTEDHYGVALNDEGGFTVRLGTGNVLIGTFNTALFEGVNRSLEVVINGERLEPRQLIGSVPYALQSDDAVFAYSAGTAAVALEVNNAAALEGTNLSALIAMIPTSWSSGMDQLATPDQVVIGTPTPSPTAQLHVAGDTVVEGSIVAGPGAVDLVAENTSLQNTLTTMQGLVSTLQADVASITTQIGGLNDNAALLSQIDQMFLTTGACPAGYGAVEEGYIKLGSTGLTTAASSRTLANPGHGHSHSLENAPYAGHLGMGTLGLGGDGDDQSLAFPLQARGALF